jgi:hypothetical protein
VRIGHGRRRNALRDVILCVDQSGSMAPSVVYAGIFAAVLAALPAVSTRLVAFDVNVVDLTAALADPVDVLFGVQLGGGTDINRALAYCQTLVTRPRETVLVLISDLFEGGDRENLLRRVAAIARSGVRMIALLALSDEGAPAYDHELAAELAARDVPAFAVTPDLFPELMSAALAGRDISDWAAGQGIRNGPLTRLAAETQRTLRRTQRSLGSGSGTRNLRARCVLCALCGYLFLGEREARMRSADTA